MLAPGFPGGSFRQFGVGKFFELTQKLPGALPGPRLHETQHLFALRAVHHVTLHHIKFQFGPEFLDPVIKLPEETAEDALADRRERVGVIEIGALGLGIEVWVHVASVSQQGLDFHRLDVRGRRQVFPATGPQS